MKRIGIFLGAIFGLLIALIFIAGGRGRSGREPRFVPGAPSSLGTFTSDHYDWLAAVPFKEGKLWAWTAGPGGTNYHTYLYDLERRVIVGELLNAGTPELWCPANSRILVQGPASPTMSLKLKLLDLFARFRRGGKPLRTESFWILDLRDNSANRLGEIEQFPGTGSRWACSPNSRYGYTMPTTAGGSWFFLCDLENRTANRVPAPGPPKGWWNDREILVEATPNTFKLLDIVERKVRSLFNPDDISKFLEQLDVTNPPAGLDVFANWNGRDYDFYFGPKGEVDGLKGTGAFLLKAERTGPSLKLVYRDFKSQWGGHLNSDATHYLYQGETGAPGKGGNGAVFLRDLTNDTTRTVVAPDNSGQYAIPRFYNDEVIYFRNRLLHRVALNGSNDAPLLPTKGK